MVDIPHGRHETLIEILREFLGRRLLSREHDGCRSTATAALRSGEPGA